MINEHSIAQAFSDLRDKSLSFAKRLGCTWSDTGGHDCKAYQRRYLYVHAFGAFSTAKSYWILHESKCFSDCVILARNLLERIISSGVGAKSPAHAVELISHELSDKIRRAKLWTPSPNIAKRLGDMIKEHERDLSTFLSLIGKRKAPAWGKFEKRFDEAGLPGFYRSVYFEFSRYAHAGYEVPRPENHDRRSKAADFIALVAPVITAGNCHLVDCPDCNQGKCGVHEESMALLEDFSSRVLENTSGNIGERTDKT
jgi:Family of unknown function (DUF5677)